MKQRIVVTVFFGLFLLFVVGLFIVAQFTSLSGNPISDQSQSQIWAGNVAVSAILLVILISSLVSSLFYRNYFGMHNHLIKRNLWLRFGATCLVLIFFIVLSINKQDRTLVAIMTWLNVFVLAFVTYLEGRSLVKLYLNR